MIVNSINNQPSFQAKLIVIDSRVDKFIDSTFTQQRKNAFTLYDKLLDVHPGTFLTARISGGEENPRLVIKNLKNRQTQDIELDSADIVSTKDRNAFYELISRLLDESSKKIQEFWK